MNRKMLKGKPRKRRTLAPAVKQKSLKKAP